MGGPVGCKGFALGLLVEILGSALAGIDSTDARSAVGNGMCFVVIDPSRFVPLDRFRTLIDDLSAYVKTSHLADGVGEILMPGEREFQTRRAARERHPRR